ncbi:hypothetical protein QOZ80_9AG0678870 [Eleusine coracana subsp. coracana]|nr:hypothetical protein QOZ80_9AG0678870 [Eleusine coracana subsp. coracana]
MASAASLAAASSHRHAGLSTTPSSPRSHQQPRPTARFPAHRTRSVRLPLLLRASASASSAPAGSDRAAGLERCLAATPASAPPEMKGGRRRSGAFGAVTIEKAPLDLAKRLKKAHPELATGGGGGDIGKIIGHRGGDGGDDDGDDDDYFDDFEDGDEEGGFFRRRIVIQELFKKEFVDAVLQEWYKSMSNLPAGLRQAYEMGLVSSAQMVQYLSVFGRPTRARYVSRAFPSFFSRGLVGRMLADPSFLHKMTFEFLATFSSSVWWEMKNRKERFRQELDLVFVNVFAATICNLAVFCSLAPCRSYMIQRVPNNIFEKSYPMRQLSIAVPSISTNALSYGAFYGLYANLRYQMLCGLDRFIVHHFDVLGVAMFFSTAIRLMNIQIGEVSRRAWLGEEADLLHSDNLLRAYNGPAELVLDQQQQGWFISKDAIVSGLRLLGIKQGQGTSPKPRRKRIVRKVPAS